MRLLVLGMQLRYEDGRFEADGAHPRAIFQIPQYTFPILACAEEIAVVSRPAERLYLARVATELARDAVGLNIKYDYYAIVLRCN